MRKSKVSVRGQTVIPQEIREQMGIKPRSELAWSASNGVIVVVPIPEDAIEASIGLLAGKGYTLDDFLRERGQERQQEREADQKDDERIRRALKKGSKL